jgi:hypothetical protein
MIDLGDALNRAWDDIVARPSGPLAFRFYIQPLMAVLLAVRDGIKDARTGREPYLWSIVTDPARRREHLREGIRAVWKILALAIVLDLVYQVLVLKTFYIGETLVVSVSLAFIPYALMRGPIARLWRTRSRGIESSTPE